MGYLNLHPLSPALKSLLPIPEESLTSPGLLAGPVVAMKVIASTSVVLKNHRW
jgi:hypothetical protein